MRAKRRIKGAIFAGAVVGIFCLAPLASANSPISGTIAATNTKLGSVAVNSAGKTTAIAVTNTSAKDVLNISSASFDSSAKGNYSVEPTSSCINAKLQPKATCVFDVLFTPKQVGTANVTMTVNANSGVKITKPLSAVVTPITASTFPTSIDFGTVAFTDTSNPINETIINTSNVGTLTISGVSVQNAVNGNFTIAAGSTCNGVNLAPGASCGFKVNFAHVGAGPASANVVVASNANSPIAVGVSANVTDSPGYYVVGNGGVVKAYGSTRQVAAVTSSSPIVAAALTSTGGLLRTSASGQVFASNGASNLNANGLNLTKPIVGLATTPSGNGFWLVGSDGGIYAYGDASFYGSAGGVTSNTPIVGIAATSDGKGYWLVSGSGNIFAYGDAKFYGSLTATSNNIVGIAASIDGAGYWLVGSDGTVYVYGDAKFYGSASGTGANVVGIARTAAGTGYWLTASDGTVYAYGTAKIFSALDTQVIGKAVAIQSAAAVPPTCKTNSLRICVIPAPGRSLP